MLPQRKTEEEKEEEDDLLDDEDDDDEEEEEGKQNKPDEHIASQDVIKVPIPIHTLSVEGLKGANAALCCTS